MKSTAYINIAKSDGEPLYVRADKIIAWKPMYGRGVVVGVSVWLEGMPTHFGGDISLKEFDRRLWAAIDPDGAR